MLALLRAMAVTLTPTTFLRITDQMDDYSLALLTVCALPHHAVLAQALPWHC